MFDLETGFFVEFVYFYDLRPQIMLLSSLSWNTGNFFLKLIDVQLDKPLKGKIFMVNVKIFFD